MKFANVLTHRLLPSMKKSHNDWMKGLGPFISGAGFDWDGKGKMPRWLKEQVDEGEDILDFLNPEHPEYEKYKSQYK